MTRTATYKGFDGETYTATHRTETDLGVPALKIKNAKGRTVRHVIMSADEAEGFFMSLSREAED